MSNKGINTIPTILSLAKICQYLSQYETYIDKLENGATLNKNLSLEIYQVRKNVEWLYTYNRATTDLVNIGDYLYSLCGKYISQAKLILGTGTGIIISPSTPNNSYQFTQNIIVVDGLEGSPIVNTNTYQSIELIGAEDLASITINKQIFYIGVDFSFNNILGEINFTNYIWNTGDIAVITYNKLIN